MAQTTRVIKVEESYVPVDPETYSAQLTDTAYEERLSNPKAIVAYDGKNFLPTAYGYSSYFGSSFRLDVKALQSPVDAVLVFQNAALNNFLIALCEDGIHVKTAEASGAWEHYVVHTVVANEYVPWTYTILNNELYCYRQGYDKVWKFLFNPADVVEILQPDPVDITFTITATSTTSPATAIPAATYGIAFTKEGKLTAALTKAESAHAAGTLTLTFSKADKEYKAPMRLYRETADGVISYIEYPALPYDDMVATFSLTVTGDTVWPYTLDSWPDTPWLAGGSINLYAKPVPITPQFLNLAGQKGVFRAGIRLGFWDAENSISWSAIDDPTDFEPSLDTLAGSSIFADVTGSIVTCVPMGTGFVIYATKSIVLVRKNLDSSFGWTPSKIAEFGIAYPKQVTCSPDVSEHYVYTDNGIFHIKGAEVVAIVPSFYEVVKKSDLPVYVTLLSNRYLLFQIMDPVLDMRMTRTRVDSIEGQVWQLSEEIISGGYSSDFLEHEGDGFCKAAASVPAVHNGGASGVPGNGNPSAPSYDPYYRTRYSCSFVPDQIVWTAGGPCPTTDINDVALDFYPSNVLTTSDNSFIVIDDNPSGDEASFYFQNLDKFVATQTALWQKMDEKRAQLLAQISGKTYYGKNLSRDQAYTTPGSNYMGGLEDIWGITLGDPAGEAPAAGVPGVGTCDIGYIPILFSDPYLHVTECGAFFTRICIARQKVYRLTNTTTGKKTITQEGQAGWHFQNNLYPGWAPVADDGTWFTHFTTTLYPSPADFESAWMAYSGGTPSLGQQTPRQTIVHSEDSVEVKFWHAFVNQYDRAYVACKFTPGRCQTFNDKRHTLLLGEIEYGSFAVDQASMTILGWKKRFNSNPAYPALIPAVGTCNPPTPPTPPYKSPTSTYGFPGDTKTGNICGEGVDPIDVYGEPLVWPAQFVNLPAAYWLMQQGSGAPAYPTFVSSFVYDTLLKKWGRHNEQHKLYVDYQPVNNTENQAIPYGAFQIKAGALHVDGTISLFDNNPSISEICYGKIGYYRTGYTDIHEVTVQFASPSTGRLKVEPSYDGRFAEVNNVESITYADTYSATLFPNLSGKWYNIVVSGKYDISYIEFKGRKAGRR